MWLWHAPALYDAAVRHPLVHGLEHLSFVTSAAVFWWAVAGGRRSRFGAAVIVVFLGALPGTALGAAMLLAPRAWYPRYPDLSDQQLAGVVMWAFSGLIYVVGAVALFATWLSGLDRSTPGATAPRAGPWVMGGSR